MKRKETKISVFRMFVEVVGYLLLMHSGPIASLGLRQSCVFKDKQRSFKTVDESSRPHSTISDCFPIIGSCSKIVPDGL